MVFGFAVPDGLPPVVGAAPYDVIARQVPRQLVQLLNGREDRGVRFLPFLGNLGGQRRFLPVRQPLPPATLAALHRRGSVGLLVDGQVAADRVRLRVHDGVSLHTRVDLELPFAPTEPFAVLPRLWFEVTTELGWTGRPMAVHLPDGPTLSWLLVAKDELLALEAGLPPAAGVDVLRAARHCVGAAADLPVVQDVALETAAHLLRGGRPRESVVELLRELAGCAPDVPEVLRRLGGMLQVCEDERTAAAVWTRVARLDPGPEAVETAAALWFRQARPELARDVLLAARAGGSLSVSGLGQLAAVADRLGDRALRDELADELLRARPLPWAVARLLVTILIEREQPEQARAVAEESLREPDRPAGLWLDLGRACLMMDDGAAAALALESARAAADAGPELRRDVDRLLRLCAVPRLFGSMRRADAALERGDRRTALRLAREVVRGAGGSGDAWLFLGVVRHKLRQDRRAEVALRRALELDGTLAEAHNRLGILLVGRGAFDEGLSHLRTAESLAPNDPSPQLHLAQACALAGQPADGRRHLEQAGRLGANQQLLAAIRRQFFARGA